MTGSSGTLKFYFYPGNPTSVSTSIINPEQYVLVLDTTNGVLYMKTSAKGDNSGYSALANVTAANITPASVAATGAITSSSATAGIGYATGSGGAVTQATDKSTGVTLAKVNGAITMNNASLADATTVTFTVTATGAITANDVVIVNHISGGTLGAYLVWAHTIAADSYKISVRNVSGGALSEALVIQSLILAGVAS